MRQKIFFYLLFSLTANFIIAQSVAINNDGSNANSSAILDVKSSTKGVLVPRMSKTQRNAIIAPATGLLIYQDAPDSTGFYFYDGVKWTPFASLLPSTTISVSMGLQGNATATPTLITPTSSYFGLVSSGVNNYYELPTASTSVGKVFYFRNNNDGGSGNSVFIRSASGSLLCPGSSTCLGSGTYYELKPTTSVKTIMCISDGVNWTVGKIE
jgi:hypothetical protein